MNGLIITFVIVLASILFLLGLVYYALRYIFRKIEIKMKRLN